MRKLSTKQIDRLVLRIGCIGFWAIGSLYIMFNFHPFIGYMIGTISTILFIKPGIIE